MAFQIVNGEWTTRTLDVDAVLRHFDQKDKEHSAGQEEPEKTPKFGLLTQTVVRSPTAHWILPVRIRDIKFHDVAIIGDDFVQIKELRSDGLLWDVIQKDDFGARIRNAAVIGTLNAGEEKAHDAQLQSSRANDNDDTDSGPEVNVPKAGSISTGSLPPQFLVLQLETGDSLFMMLQPDDQGELHFVMSTYRVPKPMIKLQPGINMAVDPTSHYMAVGTSETLFAIYELQSRAVLEKEFAEGKKLNHVAACTIQPTFDVIMNMVFLYPTPGCEESIMLLVVVSQRFKTRLIYHEWLSGQDLNEIRPNSMSGHQLVYEHSVPLLLIPLKFQSALVLICEKTMCVYTGITENSPRYQPFDSDANPVPASRYYNGNNRPLWTSWARPAYRHHLFRAKLDSIYIVREDGVLKNLEFDQDLGVEYNTVGDFNASCGTAFACLDFKAGHKDGDLFVSGGDACSGGTYLLQARGSQESIEPIQNWTPAHDFVATYNASTAHVKGKISLNKEFIPKPDRIFMCTGKGEGASITELRHGLEAKIGVIAPFDDFVLQAWALPPGFKSYHDPSSTLFLLSFGDVSSVLALPADLSDMEILGEESTSLDLDHRTITVSVQQQSVIQVTEKSIQSIGTDFAHKYLTSDIVGMIGDSIDNACVSDSAILFTAYVDHLAYLQVLELRSLAPNMDLDEVTLVRTLIALPLSVTSLLIGQIGQNQFAITAEWSETSNGLSFQPISGGERHEVDLQELLFDSPRLDAVGSLLFLDCLVDTFLVLCGTRNGLLITCEISVKTFKVVKHRVDRIGSNTVLLTMDTRREHEHSFFISCDFRLYHSKPNFSRRSQNSTRRPWHNQVHNIRQVWLTDVGEPYLCQPNISTFTQLCRAANSTTDFNNNLLLVNESQISVAALSAEATIVPRKIKIKGTPSRLLFSPALNTLVVAVSINGKSALQFVDPETGEDLSEPIDQTSKQPIEFVSGLGHDNERIWGLYEWKFTKDATTWNFIIVATTMGRVLMIAIDYSNSQANGSRHGEARKIRYYTRYRFRSQQSVFSVTGFPQGLLWCAGTKLYCDVLDQVNKKFVRAAEHDLPSPALRLEYSDGIIFALTQAHSLEILKLTLNEGETSSIIRTHGDQLTRAALDHIMVQSSGSTLHLVSDKLCSLAGLFPITNTRADTLETVFDAELSHSILRFRSTNCRPPWDESWNKKSIDTTNRSGNLVKDHQPEILGLSIMGSLSHLSILDYKAWNYLRFIVDLALTSKNVCRFTYLDGPAPMVPVTEPKTRMQIDGDILKRCLDGGRLEELLRMNQHGPKSREIFENFCHLLREYHEGQFDRNSKPEVYIDQAYMDISFFLRPVL